MDFGLNSFAHLGQVFSGFLQDLSHLPEAPTDHAKLEAAVDCHELNEKGLFGCSCKSII
jgi:hypothetical protein